MKSEELKKYVGKIVILKFTDNTSVEGVLEKDNYVYYVNDIGFNPIIVKEVVCSEQKIND